MKGRQEGRRQAFPYRKCAHKPLRGPREGPAPSRGPGHHRQPQNEGTMGDNDATNGAEPHMKTQPSFLTCWP